ncbi:alpha/beta hydrolase family protein [Dactylosporangium sp. McL0621]|uniref:alpha/beta hydrolase family protein n=1 Tax=Dactylosporangium sp. McL0621 TaxID=3415678 RepID=UPI003CF1B0E4
MRIVLLAACGLVLTGCAGSASTNTPADASKGASVVAAPGPTNGWCADPELNDKQVTFASQGGYLAAYLLGEARAKIALVLAPQSGADACSWLGWAKQQAAAGYRVLAFDFNGEGRSVRGITGTFTPSGDVAAAAAYAREHGAVSVVLIGASRGGTAVLVAAARLTPPAAGVVSVSGVAEYMYENAVQAVPRLTMPVLYLVAKDDSPAADDAQAMYAATPGERRTLSVVPGRGHGRALVTVGADGSAEASAAIAAFLTANAKPA